jgi:hypothetical protein
MVHHKQHNNKKFIDGKSHNMDGLSAILMLDFDEIIASVQIIRK